MALKKIIVVRHGVYDRWGGGGKLTSDGQEKVRSLGETLATLFGGQRLIVLTSSATRAVETAAIITDRLAVPPAEQYQFLHSEGDRLERGQVDKAMALITTKAEEFDVIILSTHMEFIDEFPTCWGAHHRFQIPKTFNASNASARVIDVATGEVEHLHP